MEQEKKKVPERVFVPYGVNKLLAKRFNCTPEWVSKSLNGHKNSEMSIKIRFVALREYNGIEIPNHQYYERL